MTLDRAQIHEALVERVLPLQYRGFWDAQHGGFHERLGADLTPLPLGYKRLLVQCRQIYQFSHAYLLTQRATYAERAYDGFQFLRRYFRDQRYGGWYFKTTPNGETLDPHKDCYGHAFVLFALAYYWRASRDANALNEIHHTGEMLERKLADAHGGFHEAADEDWTARRAPRRQNPHMHLLEGYLALYEATSDESFREQALSILDLFHRYFFDSKSATLGEYFTAAWAPDAERGHIVEPGHHFEWAWLLHSCAHKLDRPNLINTARRLWEWGFTHGVDTEQWGIYDEVDRGGVARKTDKRIWPLIECVKACAVLARDENSALASRPAWTRLSSVLDLLFTRYLLNDGRWHEHLDRAGKPLHDELPGSTGYHLTLGLSEALKAAPG